MEGALRIQGGGDGERGQGRGLHEGVGATTGKDLGWFHEAVRFFGKGEEVARLVQQHEESVRVKRKWSGKVVQRILRERILGAVGFDNNNSVAAKDQVLSGRELGELISAAKRVVVDRHGRGRSTAPSASLQEKSPRKKTGPLGPAAEKIFRDWVLTAEENEMGDLVEEVFTSGCWK